MLASAYLESAGALLHPPGLARCQRVVNIRHTMNSDSEYNGLRPRFDTSGMADGGCAASTHKCPSEFMTHAQLEGAAQLCLARLRAGDSPSELEQAIIAYLNTLPDGLLADNGWKVEDMACLMTLAAILTGIAHKLGRLS